MSKKLLTVNEIAEQFGFKRGTVQSWFTQGRVRGTKIKPKGKGHEIWYADPADIQRFLDERNQVRARFNTSAEAKAKTEERAKKGQVAKIDQDVFRRAELAMLERRRIVRELVESGKLELEDVKMYVLEQMMARRTTRRKDNE